jgi:hypothetical protein
MTPQEREALIEAVASAWRPRDGNGVLRAHPAWADLDDDGRAEAFEAAAEERALDAAVDPRGLSATGRAVLARIRGGRS